VLVSRALHRVKAHLEHVLLPEGFFLRVQLVTCQRSMRRLAARGFGSRPPGMRGIIQRELPSLTRRVRGGEK